MIYGAFHEGHDYLPWKEYRPDFGVEDLDTCVKADAALMFMQISDQGMGMIVENQHLSHALKIILISFENFANTHGTSVPELIEGILESE
jgi:hypothetical protein